MRIRLNGDHREVEESTTLGSLVDQLGLDRNWVVAERNSEVPDRRSWDETFLQESDQIELVRFMGGGA
jgi:thiamine biosynthesis protein ThiS